MLKDCRNWFLWKLSKGKRKLNNRLPLTNSSRLRYKLLCRANKRWRVDSCNSISVNGPRISRSAANLMPVTQPGRPSSSEGLALGPKRALASISSGQLSTRLRGGLTWNHGSNSSASLPTGLLSAPSSCISPTTCPVMSWLPVSAQLSMKKQCSTLLPYLVKDARYP